MLRPSSSISSSERAHARRLRNVLVTCAWTLLCLAVLDVVVGLTFPMPVDPRRRPDKMAQYFDYGRSIDGKIAFMLGPDEAHSAPITRSGWIDRDCRHAPPPVAPGHRGLTIYGMSFTDRIARQLRQLDPRWTVNAYSGPEASPNHSYACFELVQQAGHDPDEVQVLGVLASSLTRMVTLTAATTSFEAPQPFTYPRYGVDGHGALTTIAPIVRSPADMRDSAKWAAFTAQLARHDVFYDPVQFGGEWADHSVFLRLLRRAEGQAQNRRRTFRDVFDGAQYRPAMAPPTRALLVSFARQVRARGQRPIIVLLQDTSFGTDALARLVGTAPELAGATIIRSDRIASADDPRNFLDDGHFTPRIDRLLAQELLRDIDERGKQGCCLAEGRRHHPQPLV